MLPSMKGRSFVKELDHTPDELIGLVALASSLKADRAKGNEQQHLAGRVIALIFEKTSTRTRAAFEVAAAHQGAAVTYLAPDGSQIGHKESIADTAQVLGRMYDGIQYRGYSQEAVETLASHAGVPVWNGLTDQWHPTQMLADVLTMREHCAKPLDEIAHVYVGDARNNMGHSTLITGAMLGMDVRLCAPAHLQPDADLVSQARSIAADTGARITITDDVAQGVAGADFVSTDVWVSMGEPEDVWAERIAQLTPYRVDATLMAATGNDHVKFLHCLPAYHDRHSAIGQTMFERYGLDGVEVTDEVFASPASIVFDQAENRLHTIKAVMVATLA